MDCGQRRTEGALRGGNWVLLSVFRVPIGVIGVIRVIRIVVVQKRLSRKISFFVGVCYQRRDCRTTSPSLVLDAAAVDVACTPRLLVISLVAAVACISAPSIVIVTNWVIVIAPSPVSVVSREWCLARPTRGSRGRCSALVSDKHKRKGMRKSMVRSTWQGRR